MRVGTYNGAGRYTAGMRNVILGLMTVALMAALGLVLCQGLQAEPPVVIKSGEYPSLRTYSHSGCDFVVASSRHGVGITHSPTCRNAGHADSVAQGR
jgi:hypothetical protein